MARKIARRPATALAVLAAMLVAGCSARDSVPSSPVVAASPETTSPSLRRISVVLKNAGAIAAALAARRRPQYVSPSTTGVVLAVSDTTAKTTATYGFDVSPAAADASSSCAATSTDGTRTCQLSFLAAAGDSITVGATLYDAVPAPLGAGAAANGNALAAGTSSATTIVANANTVASVTLDGIAARLQTEVLGVPDVGVFEKLPYVTFHAVDFDGNPIDAYDAYTPFATPLSIAISDHGDVTGCSPRCMGFNFGLTTTTATIAQPQNDDTNDERPQLFLKFATGSQTDGTGDESTVPPYYAEMIANPNAGATAPNTPNSGIAYVAPLFAYPSIASVTSATPGKIYADQFLPPTGTAAMPYTVNAAACSDIASSSAPAPATWGAAFTFTGKTNGSCPITLDDGVAADAVGGTVAVSGFTTAAVDPVQVATASSAGAAAASLTVTSQFAVSPGDMFLLIVAQGPTTPQLGTVATPAGYTQIANAGAIGSPANGYAVFAKQIASTSDTSATVAFPAGTTGALSAYLAEFTNTTPGLVSSVTAGSPAQAQSATFTTTTPTITPDAPNVYIVTAAISQFYRGATATDPYSATSGYSEAFATGGTSPVGTDAASLDVQAETQFGEPVVATSNTFTSSLNLGTTPRPASEDIIFYLRPQH